MPDAVLFQSDGPVCTILLNRPECRNAVDGRPPRRCSTRSSVSKPIARYALPCWAAPAATSVPAPI